MSDFMGPPWQMDWVDTARTTRDSLPKPVRDLIDGIRAELVTAEDPYFAFRAWPGTPQRSRRVARPRE
ncbi:hypothetical protein [Streptomyces sp. NPDC051183]|uniref:hypothetical protein n=1 Tax=Streptomyces sp. NPDC051183 TaxID=3155165 RepID=UPI00343E483A